MIYLFGTPEIINVCYMYPNTRCSFLYIIRWFNTFIFVKIYYTFHHLSISKYRFLPTGLPIIPSESILSISCSFFSGKGLFTSSTGGRALIFLPCIPVFLCHKPDLGCIPHHRLRFGDPTTPSFNGCIDTLPTTHWQRSSISIYFGLF